MHRVFPAQPVEIRPERIGAKQFGIAGIELLKRDRLGALARGLLVGILNEIDRPMHGQAPYCPLPAWLTEARSFERITARCARQSKGEFRPFGRLRAADPANAPFSASSARDKLI